MHDMKAIFKKHVKKHKRKILLGSPIIILIIVLDAFNFFANEKTALILLPEPSRFVTVDRSFATTVKLVARTAVNAVGGSIRFNSENADILDVSQKNSIINLWAEEPTFLEEKRGVSFQGGILSEGGFVGEGPLMKIFFKPRKTGKITLAFENPQVLAHDGKGTNVLGGKNELTYVVRDSNLSSPDINGDNAVTFSDISIFLVNWPVTSDVGKYDFNDDGKVTFSDINALFAQLGS